MLEFQDWDLAISALAGGILSFCLGALVAAVLRPFSAWAVSAQEWRYLPTALRRADLLLIALASRLTGTCRYEFWHRWPRFVLFFTGCGLAAAFTEIRFSFFALALGTAGIAGVIRHWSWDESAKRGDLSMPSFIRVVASHRRLQDSLLADLSRPAIGSLLALLFLAPIGVFRLIGPALDAQSNVLAGAMQTAGTVWFQIAQSLPVIHNFVALGTGDNPLMVLLNAVVELILLGVAFEILRLNLNVARQLDLRNLERRLRTGTYAERVKAIAALAGLYSKGRTDAADVLEQTFWTCLDSEAPRRNLDDAYIINRYRYQVARQRKDITVLLKLVRETQQLVVWYPKSSLKAKWTELQLRLGGAHLDVGKLLGRNSRPWFLAAIATLNEASTAMEAGTEKAEAFTELGDALYRFPADNLEEGRSNLRAAMEAYREALSQPGVPLRLSERISKSLQNAERHLAMAGPES